MVKDFLRRAISETQRYRIKVVVKKIGSALISVLPQRRLATAPPITIFMVNTNNRYALQLTIESLLKHTKYPNFEIWVADNNSSDGSVEYLESIQGKVPLKIIRAEKNRQHPEWLDWAYRNIETPYWIGMDEDLYFLGSDPLMDLVATMEQDPMLYIIGGERCVYNGAFQEPVSDGLVQLAERFSAYLFIMRTSLRDKVDTSFKFVMEPGATPDAYSICYDTGGKLQSDAMKQGLKCIYMPRLFWFKWLHIGNLTWVFNFKIGEETRKFKNYQLQDIKRRLETGKI